jgi:hypothetical protein
MSSSVLNVNNVMTNYSTKVTNFTKFVWFVCLHCKTWTLKNKTLIAMNLWRITSVAMQVQLELYGLTFIVLNV